MENIIKHKNTFSVNLCPCNNFVIDNKGTYQIDGLIGCHDGMRKNNRCVMTKFMIYEFRFDNVDKNVYDEVVHSVIEYVGSLNVKYSNLDQWSGGSPLIKIYCTYGSETFQKLLSLDLVDHNSYDVQSECYEY